MIYFAICMNYWGKGKTADAARRNMIKSKGARPDRFVVIETDDREAYVNGMDGDLMTRPGATTRIIERVGSQAE